MTSETVTPYPNLDEAVALVAELRPLGTVATQILQITEGERFSAHELANVISSDQALTAKMLRLSNSAYYGFPRRITTVRDAVVLLGFRAVRSATLASCVIEAAAGETLADYRTFWQFSVTVGMLAEVLGRAERTHQNEAFTAGVLHNIGRLALGQHFTEALHVSREYALSHGVALHEAERELLGWTDAELGGGIAMAWNFPEPLVEAVLQHTWPISQFENPRSLAAFVSRARTFARSSGLSDGLEPDTLLTEPPLDWSQPTIATALRRAGGLDGVLSRAGMFLDTLTS